MIHGIKDIPNQGLGVAPSDRCVSKSAKMGHCAKIFYIYFLDFKGFPNFIQCGIIF